MKHLKKYNESTQEFSFLDIIDILQDIIDEGHDVVIYSANGHSWRPEDINKDISLFKFNRYVNEGKKFKVQISFKSSGHWSSSDYNNLVDFLEEMKVPVARFEDAGFYTDTWYIEVVGENGRKEVWYTYNGSVGKSIEKGQEVHNDDNWTWGETE
jgi:hypothetical protein